MENFATLAQRMVELKSRWDFLSTRHSSSSRNSEVMSIKMQVQSLKERMDKYGCRDEVIVIHLELKCKGPDTGVFSDYKMTFTGLLEKNQEDWIPLIKYRLETKYQGYFEFVKILGFQTYRTGFLSAL